MAYPMAYNGELPQYSMYGAMNGPEAYGTSPYVSEGTHLSAHKTLNKGVFLSKQHRRLNIVPMGLGVLLPWGLFFVIACVMSFKIQYEKPWLAYSVVVAGLVAIGVLFMVVLDAIKKKRSGNPMREPTWLIFFFLSCLGMWIAGLVAGEYNYVTHMRPYYDILGLGSYFSVDPGRMRGGQLMDSGRVTFSDNSRLDNKMAMGFRNIDVYCVAPITSIPSGNDTKLDTYDFWAVGKNCCLSSPDGEIGYQCGHAVSSKAHAALRLMDENDRPFYRLAVQQAEAAYGITAAHPLFYTWMLDPAKEVESFNEDGQRYFNSVVFSALVIQLILVMTAAVGFARLGQL